MRELGSEKRKNENEWKTLINEERKGGGSNEWGKEGKNFYN